MSFYDQLLRFFQSSDSGQDNAASIQPIENEKLVPEVLNRAVEHLRKRTERVRDSVETLLYLADYDRGFVLRSDAKFKFHSETGGRYSLQMVVGTEDDLWVYPALTPGRTSGGRKKGGLVFVSGLPYAGVYLTNDITFAVNADYVGHRGYADGKNYDGGGGNPAISLGANGVTLSLVADPAVAGGTITSTISGAPKRDITVTYGTQGSSTTIDQIIAYVNNTANNFSGETYGPARFFRASRDPATPGTAAPTAFTGGVVRGAYDAEAHQVTAAQLAAFFGVTDNHLREGECLAIAYVPGPVETGVAVPKGGRRQSLWDLPTDRAGTVVQNTTPSVGYNLINTGFEPHKIPGAIPIGKVVEGEFIFVDGTRLGLEGEAFLGESTTIWDRLAAVAANVSGARSVGVEYSEYFHAWTDDDNEVAGHKRVGNTTLLATLNQLIEYYGRTTTDNSGTRRVGAEALTGTTTAQNAANLVSLAAGSLREQLAALLSAINRRVSENGHFMVGAAPLAKNFGAAGQPSAGAMFLQSILHNPTDLLSVSAAPDLASLTLQAIIYVNGADPTNDFLAADESFSFADADELVAAMSGTRFGNVVGRLPVVSLSGAATEVPLVYAQITGLTGAADAADGWYYVAGYNTGTKQIRFLRMDYSAPDFTGMSDPVAVTLYTAISVGNDWRHTRVRVSQFSAATHPWAVFGATNANARLLDVYTPNGGGGVAGTLGARYFPDRIEFAPFDGTKSTLNLLKTADHDLLDGVETSTPVDATTNHHHGEKLTGLVAVNPPTVVNGGFTGLSTASAGTEVAVSTLAGRFVAAVVISYTIALKPTAGSGGSPTDTFHALVFKDEDENILATVAITFKAEATTLHTFYGQLVLPLRNNHYYVQRSSISINVTEADSTYEFSYIAKEYGYTNT